jgi:hypothetical protein
LVSNAVLSERVAALLAEVSGLQEELGHARDRADRLEDELRAILTGVRRP